MKTHLYCLYFLSLDFSITAFIKIKDVNISSITDTVIG